jgi:hypothetical protein
MEHNLDVCVTRAILRAERLEGSAEAAAAYGEVSRYEEALAALHPADDVEGTVARLGAVTAAVRAGQPERARRLARFYAEDPLLAPEWRARIDAAAPPIRVSVLESTQVIRARFYEPVG